MPAQTKTIIFVLLFAISIIAKSQFVECLNMPNNTNKHILETYGNAQIGSNTINSLLFKKYINNGFINDAEKPNIFNSNNASLHFGFETNYGFRYSFMPDSLCKKKNKVVFNFGAQQKQIASVLFNKNVAEALLYGNSAFANSNDTTYLQPTTLQNFNYQKISVGAVFTKENDSATSNLFVQISYVNGKKISELVTHRSYLFFDDTTYSTSGKVDFVYLQSPRNNAYFASTGKGAVVDLGFSYKLKNTQIAIALNDIGFVNWKNLNVLRVDTTFIFNGYKIDMQRALHDSDYKVTVDSLFNVSNHKSTKSFIVSSPYTLRFNAQTTWGKGLLETGLNVTFKNIVAYTPRIIINQSYLVSTKIKVGAFVGNGGYSRFLYGVFCNAQLSQFAFAIAILNPPQLFINKAKLVGGVSLNLAYKW